MIPVVEVESRHIRMRNIGGNSEMTVRIRVFGNGSPVVEVVIGADAGFPEWELGSKRSVTTISVYFKFLESVSLQTSFPRALGCAASNRTANYVLVSSRRMAVSGHFVEEYSRS
jgi:hypothetical protein